MKKIAENRAVYRQFPIRQRGFTLVELMISLVLSLLVVLAATSALLVSRSGFNDVDAASQLRDNARFATDFVTRLAVQSGFKDVNYLDSTKESQFSSISSATTSSPPLSGFTNARFDSSGLTASDPLNSAQSNSRNSCPASSTDPTLCANFSDILVMRYQAGSINTESAVSATNVSDQAMFNCAGISEDTAPANKGDAIESMLGVEMSGPSGNQEPALSCRYRTGVNLPWVSASTPLVQGVEMFKVLYGTDGVVPNTVPVAAAAIGATPNPVIGQPDSVPDRYLTAEQLNVSGNTAATNENWRRVRSLRIGMVLRSASGSTQGVKRRYYAFSPSATLTSAPSAGAFSAVGSYVDVPATDTRLRQVVTFTVYLHNYQGT